MIENPQLIVEPSRVVVADDREDARAGRWRFMGGLLIALGVLSVIVYPDARGTGEILALIIPALIVILGAVLWLIVGKRRRELVPLAELTPFPGRLHVLRGSSVEFPDLERTIDVHEIHDVVFGMTKHGLPGSHAKVEAFTVCVRLVDDSVLPIIEASPRKSESFAIANRLGDLLQVPVTQTGLGYR